MANFRVRLKPTQTMRVIVAERLAREERLRQERTQRLERIRQERDEIQASIAETVDLAKARGEQVDRKEGRVRIARDGLVWLRDKRNVPAKYYDAALKFREDYERANGTGVVSCLADQSGSGGGASGPNDAMLRARDDLKEALAALGSPLLHPYVINVAGEGRMLSDPVFGPDPKRAEQHYIPCVIALDILARHYRMIR